MAHGQQLSSLPRVASASKELHPWMAWDPLYFSYSLEISAENKVQWEQSPSSCSGRCGGLFSLHRACSCRWVQLRQLMDSQLHARANVSPVPDLPRQTRKFPPQSFCTTTADRTQAVFPGSPFISSHGPNFVSSCDTEVISSSVQTTECLGGRSSGTSMVF